MQENQYISGAKAAKLLGISAFKFDQSVLRGVIKPSDFTNSNNSPFYSVAYILDLKDQFKKNPKMFNNPREHLKKINEIDEKRKTQHNQTLPSFSKESVDLLGEKILDALKKPLKSYIKENHRLQEKITVCIERIVWLQEQLDYMNCSCRSIHTSFCNKRPQTD